MIDKRVIKAYKTIIKSQQSTIESLQAVIQSQSKLIEKVVNNYGEQSTYNPQVVGENR